MSSREALARRLGAVVGTLALLGAGAALGLRTGFPKRILFLSVGQGDCAMIQAGGRTILIDDGPWTATFDAGARIVQPRLRQLGVDRLDMILLSHPDMDHVGGTPSLLRAYPDAVVAMSAAFAHDAEMGKRLRQWKLPPERITWLPAESAARLDDLTIRLSCPPFQEGEDANDGSMFVRVGRGRAEAVFSGDAPIKVEDEEIGWGDWSAEVMKAGHHGSRTATGRDWLRVVGPEWVIISCGKDNRYGHPNREALERIAAAGAKIARTDTEGDIEFDFEGDRLVRIR